MRIELLVLLLLSATALPDHIGDTSVAEFETSLDATGEALMGVNEVLLSDPGGIDAVSNVADVSLLVGSFVVGVTVVRLDGCSVVALDTSAGDVVVVLMLTVDGSGTETEKLPNAAMGKLFEAEKVVLEAAGAESVDGVVEIGIELIPLVCEPGSSVETVSLEAVELATIDTAVVSGEASLLTDPGAGDGEAERLVMVTRPVVNTEVLPGAWEDASAALVWLEPPLEVLADGNGGVEEDNVKLLAPLATAGTGVNADNGTADEEVAALQMTLTITSPSRPAASNVLGSKPAQVCASRLLC